MLSPVSAPRVAICILNYNGWQDTLECLKSLKKLDYPDFQTIVIDNRSTGDDAMRINSWLTNNWPSAVFIQSADNRGYAAGNNQGLRWALERDFKYTWILNNDTVVNPDSLTHLVTKAQSEPTTGLVGAMQYYYDQPDKILARGGGYINKWLAISRHCIKPTDRLDYIPGACLFMSAAMLRQIGLLDEDFFIYWEDSDISFRARKAGWALTLAEKARILHKESATMGSQSEFSDYHHAKSGKLFFNKHHPRAVPVLMLTKMLQRIRKGRFGMMPLILRAFREATH